MLRNNRLATDTKFEVVHALIKQIYGLDFYIICNIKSVVSIRQLLLITAATYNMVKSLYTNCFQCLFPFWNVLSLRLQIRVRVRPMWRHTTRRVYSQDFVTGAHGCPAPPPCLSSPARPLPSPASPSLSVPSRLWTFLPVPVSLSLFPVPPFSTGARSTYPGKLFHLRMLVGELWHIIDKKNSIYLVSYSLTLVICVIGESHRLGLEQ